MKLKLIKKLLQKFNRDLIINIEGFGVFRNEELRHDATRKLWYSFLSNNEFNSKKYKFYRCGVIVVNFIKILRERGYDGKYILLDSHHTHFTNKKPYPIVSPHKSKMNSHALLELPNKKIIDPMVGVIYDASIDTLLKRNTNETFKYLNQYKYLKENYPHRDVYTNLFYTTKEYWNSITKYQYKTF